MAWVGAAGLGTSAAIFATSAPAAAAGRCACCSLVFCNNQISLSSCQSQRNYTWSCRVCNGGCVSCVCCEVLDAGGREIASGMDCRPS